MTAALCLVLVLFALLVACVKPLGLYIANVVEGRPVWITRLGGPLERGLYALAGVRPQEEMSWKTYALALIVFNTVGLILVYALQRLQQWLPLNPQGLGAVTAQSSFNTAVSFVTNTNWQGYSGEATMSYLTQMGALTVQNFLSAATGLAVAVALIRGFARRGDDRQFLGRFDACHAVRAPAAGAAASHRAGLPGRRAELQTLSGGHHARADDL